MDDKECGFLRHDNEAVNGRSREHCRTGKKPRRVSGFSKIGSTALRHLLLLVKFTRSRLTWVGVAGVLTNMRSQSFLVEMI